MTIDQMKQIRDTLEQRLSKLGKGVDIQMLEGSKTYTDICKYLEIVYNELNKGFNKL